jgi:uncharacterized protein YbjT (DUF2867 family)
VRTRDERAEDLRRLGAKIVVGDYANYASLLAALENVESAYFCYPVGAGIAEAAGLFATAGRVQGLKRVVDLSLAATGPDSPSPQGRAQWVAEQIFEWAGFTGVHLRIAAFFMENVLLIDGQDIRQSGRIANAFGDCKLSWITGSDVGKPFGQSGSGFRARDRGGGIEQLTYAQVAETNASVISQPILYEEITPPAWREKLIAASTERGEPNIRGADHFVAQSKIRFSTLG